MSLEAFATSRPLTMGVELELQIVNRHDYDLMPGSKDLLRVMKGVALPGDVTPEITDSMIELCTGICDSYEQVLEQLTVTRDALVRSADKLNLGLSGGGTHPYQHWSKQRIFDKPRFQEISGCMAISASSSPSSVSMCTSDARVRTMRCACCMVSRDSSRT